MGRWSHYDTDEERLPENVVRVGYDADTQTYTFRDTSTGRYYESSEGNRYGALNPVGQEPDPVATTAHNEQIKKENKEGVKLMLPFVLLVLVFMLLVFKLLNGWTDGGEQVHCGQGDKEVHVKEGETCWAIAEAHSLGVEELIGRKGNEGIDCDSLRIAQAICVPA